VQSGKHQANHLNHKTATAIARPTTIPAAIDTPEDTQRLRQDLQRDEPGHRSGAVDTKADRLGVSVRSSWHGRSCD
jgi:hypothetical protein